MSLMALCTARVQTSVLLDPTEELQPQQLVPPSLEVFPVLPSNMIAAVDVLIDVKRTNARLLF